MADCSSSEPNSLLPSSRWLTSETEHVDKNDKLNAVCQCQSSCKRVVLQGYADNEAVRTKSLTNEDLEELRGCLDLGFSFKYESILKLVPTLPSLELCYYLSQHYLNNLQHCRPLHRRRLPSNPSPTGRFPAQMKMLEKLKQG